MNNNDYSAGWAGYASIYIYRMCMDMHDKTRRSFNKKWNKDKIKLALEKTYETEIKIKSNSSIRKDLLIKNLIIDLCTTANSA